VSRERYAPYKLAPLVRAELFGHRGGAKHGSIEPRVTKEGELFELSASRLALTAKLGDQAHKRPLALHRLNQHLPAFSEALLSVGLGRESELCAPLPILRGVGDNAELWVS
jgi:hypothetical protein